jgi:hypothetical protein
VNVLSSSVLKMAVSSRSLGIVSRNEHFLKDCKIKPLLFVLALIVLISFEQLTIVILNCEYILLASIKLILNIHPVNPLQTQRLGSSDTDPENVYKNLPVVLK